jgi:uncharacterized protein (TIGR02145 family)
MLIFSCELPCKNVSDVDGSVYNVVEINNECWTSQNLNVTHYRNGDSIPCVTDSSTWVNLTTGAYCNYNNDPSNANSYGRLYNWYAVIDSRGLAPEGWHVPTYNDWAALENYLGGELGAGDKMKEKDTDPLPNWDGSNSVGFNGTAAGYRNNGKFQDLGAGTSYWSSTSYDTSNSRMMGLFSSDPTSYLVYDKKTEGFSIRCIRD